MKGAMPSSPFNAADVRCARGAYGYTVHLGNSRSTVRSFELTSVICVLQCGLSKAAPRSAAAEHASTTAFNAVGGQVSSGRLAPVSAGHVAAPDPRAECWFPVRGGPDGHVEVPDPPGGPGFRLLVLSFSTSGTRGDTGPIPERGTGPGPLAR